MTGLGAVAVLLAAAASPATAQAPTIEKVDPPSWWAGYSINPVRLLIRGRNLTGARMECPRLACSGVKANAAGSYAFVDVTVPKTATPGSYPLVLRTPAGRATVPFTVAAPLPATGRFQGFGPNDVMYLIMPDRFADGDPGNDDPAVSKGVFDRSKPRFYHGGDLEGIRQHLPYLKQLGVTAIWMNPIFDNTNVVDHKEVYDGQPTTAYHGYHAIDYYGMEEHFGDFAELRRLVNDAHRLGIKIILDMVENHTSADHPWVQDSPTPTWYHGTEANHPNNTWQTWTLMDPHASPAVQRATLDGWFINLLPDLNQDDPEVARYLIQNTLWWVGVSGVDGIRQDTWPYVPRRFWRDWMSAIKAQYPKLKVVGEVMDGDPTLVAFFQGGRARFDGIDDKVDALFDYPLSWPVRRAFGQGGPLREVANMLARDWVYPDASSLVTLIDTHDVSRFMNEPGATIDGLKLAFTFLLTARGTPLIYYGDEIALPGGGDPDNRRDFPGGWPADPRDAFTAAGRTPDQEAVWRHVQKLTQLRAARPELRDSQMVNLYVADQVWVYRRGKSVVALNNGKEAAEVRLPLGSLPPDALGVCTAPRPEAGGLILTIPARKACIF